MTTDTSKHVPHVTHTAKTVPHATTPTPSTTHKEAVDRPVPTPTHTEVEQFATTTVPKAKVSPNEPPATIKVRNIHTIALNLEAGIIQPGDTGLATAAERSNLVGQYLEDA
jgi:hypothetical protein